jgi:hypothetical protein
VTSLSTKQNKPCTNRHLLVLRHTLGTHQCRHCSCCCRKPLLQTHSVRPPAHRQALSPLLLGRTGRRHLQGWRPGIHTALWHRCDPQVSLRFGLDATGPCEMLSAWEGCLQMRCCAILNARHASHTALWLHKPCAVALCSTHVHVQDACMHARVRTRLMATWAALQSWSLGPGTLQC